MKEREKLRKNKEVKLSSSELKKCLNEPRQKIAMQSSLLTRNSRCHRNPASNRSKLSEADDNETKHASFNDLPSSMGSFF